MPRPLTEKAVSLWKISGYGLNLLSDTKLTRIIAIITYGWSYSQHPDRLIESDGSWRPGLLSFIVVLTVKRYLKDLRYICHSSRAQWPEHGNSLTCRERQKLSLSVDELIAVLQSLERTLNPPPLVVTASIVNHCAYILISGKARKGIYRTRYSTGSCVVLPVVGAKIW